MRARLAGAVVLAFASAAAGAERAPKLTLIANGVFPPLALDFDDTRPFDLYLEEGRLQTAYSAQGRPGVELGVQYRLGRRLAIVGAGTISPRSTRASYEASLPHPLYLSSNRIATGELDDLTYSESAGHLGLGYTGGFGAFAYTVFAGPSFYRVSSQLVDRVEPRESYPFDEVSVDAPTASTRKGAPGFHVGASMAYPIASGVGLGLQVRYGRADVQLEPKPGQTTTLTAGGPQIALGLRYSF